MDEVDRRPDWLFRDDGWPSASEILDTAFPKRGTFRRGLGEGVVLSSNQGERLFCDRHLHLGTGTIPIPHFPSLNSPCLFPFLFVMSD